MQPSLDYDVLERMVQQRLSEKRFYHSRQVALEAARLAKIHRIDVEKARIAGILHDVMKEETPAIQLQMIKDSAIILSNIELHEPNLWHSLAGAVFLERMWRIDDRDILNAVANHTAGRGNMSPLEKLIFVADLTSQDRKYPDVEQVREKAEKSLELAIREAYLYILNMLIKEGRPICQNSLDAYNENVLALRGNNQTSFGNG